MARTQHPERGVQILGDGNSYLRALSHGIFGQQNEHAYSRERFGHYLETHQDVLHEWWHLHSEHSETRRVSHGGTLRSVHRGWPLPYMCGTVRSKPAVGRIPSISDSVRPLIPHSWKCSSEWLCHAWEWRLRASLLVVDCSEKMVNLAWRQLNAKTCNSVHTCVLCYIICFKSNTFFW